MRDYIEKICKECGKSIAEPYPSMQRNPPKAPSKEEADAVAESVISSYRAHWNRYHSNIAYS